MLMCVAAGCFEPLELHSSPTSGKKNTLLCLFRLLWCVMLTLPVRQWLSMVRKMQSNHFSVVLLPWGLTTGLHLSICDQQQQVGALRAFQRAAPFPPIVCKVWACWQPCQSIAAV